MRLFRPGAFMGASPALSGGGFSAEAAQFIARTTGMTGARQILYATMIDALVAGGVWAKLDALYMFAAADATTALTNLKSSSFGATASGSPTFTADSGYTGATNKYIQSGFNATTATSPNFTQNSASIFYYNFTSGANGHGMGISNAQILLTPNVGGTTVYFNLNQAFNSTHTGVVNGGVGFYLASRTGALSTDSKLYIDGTFTENGSFASAALTNDSIDILRGADVDWAGKFGCAGIGGGLTAGEVTALWNALHTYLTAVAGIG